MLRRQKKGFTLIELLVVIAIIGILAAMVFPVFARARESARKAVCLSNVKNIGLAIQMYLADNNDTLFPDEHSNEAFATYAALGMCMAPDWTSGGSAGASSFSNLGPSAPNPYLREPVILDEYIKNRDVWRCPSARFMGGARAIVPNYYPKPGGGTSFLGYWVEWANEWDWLIGPCYYNSYPPGWGGAITDSLAQGRSAMGTGTGENVDRVENKAFVRNYSFTYHPDMKLAAVNDAARFVIVADGSMMPYMSWARLAYPDTCGVSACDGWDETTCEESVFCRTTVEMLEDPQRMRGWGRHLSGTNIGFLDGHVAWYAAQALRDMAPRMTTADALAFNCSNPIGGDELEGLPPMGPGPSSPGTLSDGGSRHSVGLDCWGWP